MSVDEVWQEALARIRVAMGASPAYLTLVEPARLVAIAGHIARVEVPSRFARDQLRKSQHDMLIRATLADLAGIDELELVVPVMGSRPGREDELPPEPEPVAPTTGRTTQGILNPKYTFESFVSGAHGRFAHAAAQAVAQSPGQSYNPLFIYGGVGLGKTHLMHAIAHQILANQPQLKVAYVSSEKFTNEVINAIKDDRMMDFKNRYRTIDLLLIDDIQFIEGKERTQEEFFHTFNALYESGKQIVISSDRVPKEIQTLTERLRSRFEMGLITDIQSPDLETRIAILKKKAEADRIDAPDDVLHYIAASYPNNVRELEGAFIRVMAFASLGNMPVTGDLARQALGMLVPPRAITIEAITEEVARHHHLEVADLVGSRRTKEIAHARQVAMYLVRELTDASFGTIGMRFGGRDHSTAIHAVQAITKLLARDTVLAADVQLLTSKLKS